MRTTSVSAGARSRLHNSDGRQRFQRKRRKDILDGNTEALISAVESRCIRAIERARGGAGWFGFPWNLGHSVLAENFACGEKAAVDFLEQNFHRLSMESWALCFGGKSRVRRKSRS